MRPEALTDDGRCKACGVVAQTAFTIRSGRYTVVGHDDGRTCLIEREPERFQSTYPLTWLMFPRCEAGQHDRCVGALDQQPGVAFCICDCGHPGMT